MAKNWNAEDTALIIQEVQHPTMNNKQLAEKLGRSLQSITSKKRVEEEKLKNGTPPLDPNRSWTEEEDLALLATPFRSENDLAIELNRTKEAVHKRRDVLARNRQIERERKLTELVTGQVTAVKPERVSLEAYTTALKTEANDLLEDQTDIPKEDALTEPADFSEKMAICFRMQRQLNAARAAVSILRNKNFNSVKEFLVVMDYILDEDHIGMSEFSDERTDA